MNLLIAPDLIFSTILSAKLKTWLWAKPTIISPLSISFGGWQVFASSIISEKSFVPSALTFILFQPGYPAALVVNTLSLYEALFKGGTIQLVVKTIGPLKFVKSFLWSHQAFP